MKNTHDLPKIEGKYINLREAQIEDSAFILELRVHANKAKYLHKTKNDLQAQIAYMQRYKTLENDWYFIVENKKGENIGTNRIYPTYNQFALENHLAFYEIGSWIMSDNANFLQVLESDFLIKKVFYDLYQLGESNVFTLSAKNELVLEHHLRSGAKKAGSDTNEMLEVLVLTKDAFKKSKKNIFSLLNRK